MLTNNWANGFQFTDSLISELANKKISQSDNKVISKSANQPISQSAYLLIIFYPEYLQFFGYLLFPLPFIVLGIAYFQKKL